MNRKSVVWIGSLLLILLYFGCQRDNSGQVIDGDEKSVVINEANSNPFNGNNSYYSDSTNRKIHQLMQRKKLFFDEAESLILAEENLLVQKNGRFKLLVSTEPFKNRGDFHTQPTPHIVPRTDTQVQNKDDLLSISFEIVDGSDIIWIGDVARTTSSLRVRFDGLKGFAHKENLVRYYCKFEIEKMGNIYNSIFLNGDSISASQ